MKRLSLVFVVLALPVLCWQYSQLRKTSVQFLDQQGRTQVLILPVKDKQRLLAFMRILFAEDSFAYSLLGSKPISWACYRDPFPFVSLSAFRESFYTSNRNLRLGWKTWSKYRHLFPAAQFWVERSTRYPGVAYILIANESQLNVVVKNNQQDFQDVLHREWLTGSQLLTEAWHSSFVDDVLKGHQALIGIILGYGRDNSWEFLRGIEQATPIGCVWDEANSGIPGEIHTRLGSVDIGESLALESCPSFAGHPNSEESLALKQEYSLTKQRVVAYYQGRDFLAGTLSLLAGFRPADSYEIAEGFLADTE